MYKMNSMMMQILAGFGTSLSTYTAQNYGNRDRQRKEKGSHDILKITMILSIIVGILTHLFVRQFMGLFVNAGEIEIIILGIRYINFTSYFYPFLGYIFVA